MQNNLSELFNLLHFISPSYDINALESEFSSMIDEDKIAKLHSILRPHILRRLKVDVLKQLLPAKVALIVPVNLTPLQKRYYRAILTRNYPILNQVRSSHKTNEQPNFPRKKISSKMMNFEELISSQLYLFFGGLFLGFERRTKALFDKYSYPTSKVLQSSLSLSKRRT